MVCGPSLPGKGCAKLVPFLLMARPKIKADDHPQQPPQRFGHSGQPRHTLRKPRRRHHGGHEQCRSAKREQRSGKAVQTIHGPIKGAALGLAKFGGKLRQGRTLQRRGAGICALGVGAQQIGGVAQQVAPPPNTISKTDVINAMQPPLR